MKICTFVLQKFHDGVQLLLDSFALQRSMWLTTINLLKNPSEMVNLTQPCMEVYLEFLNQKILNKFYSSKRKNQKQQKKAKDVVEHLILKFG